MNLRYRVTLSSEECAQLQSLVCGGRAAVCRVKRAQILLASSTGATDEEIAANVAVGASTVYRTKRRFVEEGLEKALNEEPRPGAERKLSTITLVVPVPAGTVRLVRPVVEERAAVDIRDYVVTVWSDGI